MDFFHAHCVCGLAFFFNSTVFEKDNKKVANCAKDNFSLRLYFRKSSEFGL